MNPVAIYCRACADPNEAIADYWCMDCCIRWLSTVRTDDIIDTYLRTIANVTSPAHAERVRAKWAKFVVNGVKYK